MLSCDQHSGGKILGNVNNWKVHKFVFHIRFKCGQAEALGAAAAAACLPICQQTASVETSKDGNGLCVVSLISASTS